MEQFINQLTARNLYLRERDGFLILESDKGRLTKEEMAVIKEDKELTDFIMKNKQSLLDWLRQAQAKNKRIAAYPLSPLQEGMLYHTLKDPASSAYVNQNVYELSGEVDGKNLKKAWEYVLQKFTILRTGFATKNLSVPLQYVANNPELPFRQLDYTDLTDTEQSARTNELAAEEYQRGFDLDKPPLMRITLIRLGSKKYKMIWTSHHILLDGWSIPVIFGDLTKAYERYKSGLVPVPAREDHYEDYIKLIAGKPKHISKAFWASYLKGIDESSALPFTIPVDAKQPQTENTEVKLIVNQELTQKLQEMARSTNLTLSTILQGIWALLLHTYHNTDHIVFGVTASGRPDELSDSQRRVGLYINTLPLRSVFEAEKSLSDWLKIIQQNQAEAREHQHTSLSDIQKWSNCKGNLFDTMLVYENFPVVSAPDRDRQSLTITGMEGKEQTHYPLTLTGFIDHSNQCLTVKFSYSNNEIPDRFISNIKRQFGNVVNTITDNPAIKLKDIIITDHNDIRLYQTLNDTRQGTYGSKFTDKLFERQVNLYPDRIAVSFNDEKLSYFELNTRANRLAKYLLEKGIGRKSKVALLLDRGPEMVICILAAFKAGAAFIPIDINLPKDRIHFICQESEANIILTDKQGLVKLPADCQEIIAINELDTSRFDSHSPEIDRTINDLAYIIYTSGSTGQPKGVMISHKSLANFLDSMKGLLHTNEKTVIPALTTYSFDISYLEIFLPLISGGRIALADQNTASNGFKLKDHITKTNPTCVQATPATWQMLIAAGWKGNKHMTALCGGEAISPELKNKLVELAANVLNMYGPTETTIWSTVTNLTANTPITIGQPIANTHVYILDRNSNLMPPGINGELHIGGAGLAVGYLKREALNTAKFIGHPLYGRLYKTGDIASLLPDGTLAYHGRIDNQLKIRGHRIEPGEIENKLMGHPEISQVAVVGKDAKDGSKYLAAFYKSKGESPDANTLRQFLKKHLPEYMIPASFTPLSALPLTSSGKINRKELLVLASSSATGPYVPPINNAEKLMTEIWEQVLERSPIGVEDDFFTLGGNSILSIRLVSRLQKHFRVSLPELLENSQIRKLCAVIPMEKNYLQKKLKRIAEGPHTDDSRVDINNMTTEGEYNNPFERVIKADRYITRNYKEILLFGATGYYGSHILRKLLTYHGGSRIITLVRGNDSSHARSRLEKTYFGYFGESLPATVQVICGDITKDHFGLSIHAYEEIALHTDCLINCAANVKHYGLRHDFTEINTNSLSRIVDLAIYKKQKDIHHISTIGVSGLIASRQGHVGFTECDYDYEEIAGDPYVSSKRKGEKILTGARMQGVNVNIYRVGNLSYDSETGIFQHNMEDNAFYSQLKAYLTLGYMPREVGSFEITPVNEAAMAFTMLFDKADLSSQTFHIFNPNRLTADRLSDYLQKTGLPLQLVSLPDFTDKILAEYDKNEQLISRLLLHIGLLDNAEQTGTVRIPLNSATVSLLKQYGFEWKEINSLQIEKMATYAMKQNYFPRANKMPDQV
ncbi:MAG: amino acid adenylation domain-containing protein [Cyclobacteriaceae bacterium]